MSSDSSYVINGVTLAVEFNVDGSNLNVATTGGGIHVAASFAKSDMKDKDKCILMAREIARPFLMVDGEDPVINCQQAGIQSLAAALHKMK